MNLDTIINSDSLTALKKMPDNSVDCVVTSPPYYGLRDYGVEGQIGLEETLDQYIDNLNNIFNEVKRVLKDSGSCFIVIGDSYGGSRRGYWRGKTDPNRKNNYFANKIVKTYGAQDKCLCMVPSRLAIKMIESGWILRNEIIWHKPNVLPCSVKDRYTVDFEKILFFVKNKRYYFNQALEPSLTNDNSSPRGSKGVLGNVNSGRRVYNDRLNHSVSVTKEFRNKRCVWNVSTKPFRDAHFATFPLDLIEPILKSGCPSSGVVLDPFIGSGTTAIAALRLGLNYIGIELNHSYVRLAEARIAKQFHKVG